MKRHIVFIDPIEKLNIKKDSSLLLALTLKQMSQKVVILFKDDFFITSEKTTSFFLWDFEGEIGEDYRIKNFHPKEGRWMSLEAGDFFHMRIDPPFDSTYLRFLWMLASLERMGLVVLNAPRGILYFNEKLGPYGNILPSFVGTSPKGFLRWVDSMDGPFMAKPLDGYQGMGVEKWDKDSLLETRFSKKVKECAGPIMVQKFFSDVVKGEVRTVFFKKKELGTILKVPEKGKFLANIVQGADYFPHSLSRRQRSFCEKICRKLSDHGVDLIAFDLLGDYVSEVNITCPGLLVEVSHALGVNMAGKIVHDL